jgi:uncharacterized protein YuzE
MNQPIFNYDEVSDTLYISFAPGEKATGTELNENMLLRFKKQERRAVGISIFNYSIIAQPTETGIHSFPLTGLEELSEELRETVLDILQRSPVKDILSLATYTPSLAESVPVASLPEFAPLATA